MASTRMEEYFVYVYDLSEGWSDVISRCFLKKIRRIDGIYHTSLVVNGMEFEYGPKGITMKPVREEDPFLMKKYSMGIAAYPEEDIFEYLKLLSHTKFKAKDYTVYDHNCIKFTNFLCEQFLEKPLPGDLQNYPLKLGSTAVCALIQTLRKLQSRGNSF